MEDHWATEKNEVLIHATTHMEFSDIMLKETRHKRLHIVAFFLYKISRKGKSQQIHGGTGVGAKTSSKQLEKPLSSDGNGSKPNYGNVTQLYKCI